MNASLLGILFGFAFLPICATVAGVVTWASVREDSSNDGDLIRHFLVMLSICVLLIWGISKTDTVRMVLDPQFRLQSELDANPVYSTIRRVAGDDHKTLHDALARRMSQGETLREALLQERPLLTYLTNQRMGFADQKTKLAWGQLTLDSLKELQNRDPMLCYRALSSQRPVHQALAQAFSTDNTKAFQQAVIAVYESADQSIRHERPDDEPVEFNEAAREYYAIKEDIARQFGAPVAEQLSKKQFPESPVEQPEQLCSARIVQLEAMLGRPQAMASTLIDSTLR